jgi:hypothetical protein
LGLERLSRYLLDRGDITPEQLDEARRTQGFFGGQLASHLLKLGFVDEETLARALTDVTGAPYATREHLSSIPVELIGVVPAKLLKEHPACPFGLSEGRLRVAMVDPRDAATLGRIRSSTSYVIEPWVTCEYRLFQALERLFRITPEGRKSISLAPPQTGRDRKEGRNERPAEEAKPAEEPIVTPEVGLDGRPLDAVVTVDDHIYFSSGTAPSSGSTARAATRTEAVSTESDPGPLERPDEQLVDARTRDDIARALIDFCRIRASRVALFAVDKTGALRGLAGAGVGFETKRLSTVTVPAVEGSIFDAVLRNKEFHFGVVPPSPANRELYSALGSKLPVMATLLPIPVLGRVVSLLYIDDEDRPMSQPDIPLMRRVAAKSGLAFELLLLRKKLLGI